MPTGLGIENEGLEMPLNELPPWEETKVKTFPLVRHSSHELPRGINAEHAYIMPALEESRD